jgi:hypothetical protein
MIGHKSVRIDSTMMLVRIEEGREEAEVLPQRHKEREVSRRFF